MAALTLIIVLTAAAAAAAGVGNTHDSSEIPVHSVAKVISAIYHQLHSRFVFLLHESKKNEEGKYK
jgi:hypothetical protein